MEKWIFLRRSNTWWTNWVNNRLWELLGRNPSVAYNGCWMQFVDRTWRWVESMENKLLWIWSWAFTTEFVTIFNKKILNSQNKYSIQNFVLFPLKPSYHNFLFISYPLIYMHSLSSPSYFKHILLDIIPLLNKNRKYLRSEKKIDSHFQ